MTAIDRLNTIWHEKTKGKGGQHPKLIRVSDELFEAFKKELLPMQRYVNGSATGFGMNSLVFRSARVVGGMQ